MHAAIFTDLSTIVFDDVATPTAGPGEVIVRVDAATICGTDLKIYRHGKKNVRPPQILGHEFAGTVVELGAGVTSLAEGQRVAIDPVISCGVCRQCLAGRPSLCPRLTVIAYDYPGAFAEYIRIPAQGVASGAVFAVPDGLAATTAAIMEPLACALNAQERVGTGVGDRAIVVGAGPLGVMHAAIARARGAGYVAIADVLPGRLELARSFGFDGYFDASTAPIAEQAREATGGEGFDVVIVANSAVVAQEQSLALAAGGGRICFFGGLPQSTPMVSLDSNVLHYRELAVYGAFGAGRRHNALALAMLASGQIPGANIVTRTLGLSGLVEGLGMVERGEALKVAITPGLRS